MIKKYFFPILLLLLSFPSAAQRKDYIIYTVGSYSFHDSSNKTCPSISLKELLNPPRMKIQYADPSIYLKLASYEVGFLSDTIHGPYKIVGERFSPELMNALETYGGSGGKLFFDDIKALGPDNVERHWASVVIAYIR